LIGVSFSYDVSAHPLWFQSHFLGLDPNHTPTDVESASPGGTDCSQELFQEGIDPLTHALDLQQLAIPEDALIESDVNSLTLAEQNSVEQFPFSAGIQFRDLAHKFDSILTLC
jgi:hypothetical protein